MIMGGSPAVTKFTRRSGRGLGITSYDQLTPQQWYELIALTTNQPVSSVQAQYSATQPGANATNLQAAIAAHSITQSAYDNYQIGGIVDAPTGGHQFQYGGGFVGWAQSAGGSANPWAVPAQSPTADQIAASEAAGRALVSTQAQTPLPPNVVNPSPATQLTTTGTAATSTTSAVSQANGTTASSGDLLSTIAGYLSPTTSTDWITGVPNWIVVAGGGLLGLMTLAIMTRK